MQIVNNSQMIIILLMLISSKVFVIDDLNLTKRTESNNVNKKLLKSITEKISKGNEEVVLYNEKSDLRMSSRDYGINGVTKEDCLDSQKSNSKKVEIDIPVIEKTNLETQIQRYENSVNQLKNLVNTNKKISNNIPEPFRDRNMEQLQNQVSNQNFEYLGNLKSTNSGLFNNANNIYKSQKTLAKNTLDNLLSTDFDERLKRSLNDSNIGFNDQNYNNLVQPNNLLSNLNNSNQNFIDYEKNNTPILNSIDSQYSKYNNKNDNFDLDINRKNDNFDLNNDVNNLPDLHNILTNSNNNLTNSNNNLTNSNNILSSLDNLNHITSDNNFNNADRTLSSNSILSSSIPGLPYDNRLAYTKAKVQDNLYKAIDNRKEYINIKLQEIKINKDKLKIEIRSYREKVAELLVKIRRIRKTKDSIISKMTDNKNHIINLNKNSKKIVDSKEEVFSMIRVTRNEVLRYKNLLENETNKLAMLEKQYEVYEDTLKKYNEDVEQESNKLYRSTNELNKNTIDLENVESLYREYAEKNKQIEEDLRRYEKIADCLDTEEKKISRHQLSGIVI